MIMVEKEQKVANVYFTSTVVIVVAPLMDWPGLNFGDQPTSATEFQHLSLISPLVGWIEPLRHLEFNLSVFDPDSSLQLL